MTNIQAIDLLKGLEQSLDDYCELNDEGKTAFRMAITALELFGNSERLPSAQPEPLTDKKGKKMDDIISKQSAIDTIHKIIYGFFDVTEDDSEEPISEKDKLLLAVNKAICNGIKELPSAQPQSEVPDWSYNDDTAEIILVVPKDVYESTKTVFLSVGDEGKPYLRGKIYSVQPERKKGKWLDNETSFADGARQTCTCSICGRRSTRPIGDFCRWCGADMRGEQDE